MSETLSKNAERVSSEQEKKQEELQGLLEYIQSALDERDLERVYTVTEQLVADIDTFHPLTHLDIAKLVMERGLDFILATHIQHFNIDHEAIAVEMIKEGEYLMVLEGVQKFKGNHANIAKEMIYSGEGAAEEVAEYIQNFSEEYHDAIAQHFIAAGQIDLLRKHIDKFQNLTDDTITAVQ